MNAEPCITGAEETQSELGRSWCPNLAFEQWAALPVSGQLPFPRYKHAAALADGKLYVANGSCHGRYISDVQVLDLRNNTWSALRFLRTKKHINSEQTEYVGRHEHLPATAGSQMIKWGNELLLFGGHSREPSDAMKVFAIDVETGSCSTVDTSGKSPIARAGHSVTQLGSKLIVFGGEDKSRNSMNDIHVLDLETLVWDVIETTQTPPAPRFDHSAAVHAERYFLIFGGCSHSTFFSDIHILDLQTKEWYRPDLKGDLAKPRAGHGAVTVEENLYIVGGGDGKSGATETLVLNMSKLVWSVRTSVHLQDPLSSEGLSVCSASIDGGKQLVAFGGYNGRYHNEVFIMKLKPQNSSYPRILRSPAAAAAAASVTAVFGLSNGLTSSDSNINPFNSQPGHDLSGEISSIRDENIRLESALNTAREESSLLKEKIHEINMTFFDLSKELQSVQGQLVAERLRCSKLEVQIAELHKSLEVLPSIESELESLRNQSSAMKHNLVPVERQGSGTVWRWISGNA